MPIVLSHNSYGKSLVRLTKVTRHADRHDLADWSIDVRLEGDFAAAYAKGDNRKVVATDTMKNVVYALARDHSMSAPEPFARLLCNHFIDGHSQVTEALVTIRVEPWQRIAAHAFTGGGSERRTCDVRMTRNDTSIRAGIAGLMLLKTADSSFRDFDRDEFTTLPDCDDRIMATSLTADWTYRGDTDWDHAYPAIRNALVEAFASHKSRGVQQTLYAMGEAALAACLVMTEITLTMPNQHRLLVNLAPFGRDNPNEVFVATDEPHGLITGTLRRTV